MSTTSEHDPEEFLAAERDEVRRADARRKSAIATRKAAQAKLDAVEAERALLIAECAEQQDASKRDGLRGVTFAAIDAKTDLEIAQVAERQAEASLEKAARALLLAEMVQLDAKLNEDGFFRRFQREYIEPMIGLERMAYGLASRLQALGEEYAALAKRESEIGTAVGEPVRARHLTAADVRIATNIAIAIKRGAAERNNVRTEDLITALDSHYVDFNGHKQRHPFLDRNDPEGQFRRAEVLAMRALSEPTHSGK